MLTDRVMLSISPVEQLPLLGEVTSQSALLDSDQLNIPSPEFQMLNVWSGGFAPPCSAVKLKLAGPVAREGAFPPQAAVEPSKARATPRSSSERHLPVLFIAPPRHKSVLIIPENRRLATQDKTLNPKSEILNNIKWLKSKCFSLPWREGVRGRGESPSP